MKTSFYFVLWIIIYPILDYFGLQDNSFIIALLIIFVLSWILNSRFATLNIYEQFSQSAPILESLFNEDIGSVVKRLTRDFIVETITGVYLLLATALMAYMVFVLDSSETFALVIFGLITAGAMIRSNKLHKALRSIKSDPSEKNCAIVLGNAYHLNYELYQTARQTESYDDLFPYRPKFYTLFVVFSFICAIACILLGTFFIITSLLPILIDGFSILGIFYIMRFLYGSLALYFGIKDIVSILTARNKWWKK